MTVYEGKFPPMGTGKIAVVVSKYNKTITERLLEGALSRLKEGGIRDADVDVVWVPGAFEIPMMAQRFAFDPEYQAVVCLGCVIKGETTHDEHINRAVSLQLARLSVDAAVPIGFGVLTCNTIEQAAARSTMQTPGSDKTAGEQLGNKGVEAASAVLEMLDIVSQLPEPAPFEDADDSFLSSLEANVRRYRDGEFDDEEDVFDEYDDDDEYDRRRPPRFDRDYAPRHGKGTDRKKDGKFSHDKKARKEGKSHGEHGKKGKSKSSKKGK